MNELQLWSDDGAAGDNCSKCQSKSVEDEHWSRLGLHSRSGCWEDHHGKEFHVLHMTTMEPKFLVMMIPTTSNILT